jgi:predicted RNA-binding protein with RPS1 domain
VKYFLFENLIDSMTQMDPRLREPTGVHTVSKAGSVDGCVLLSPELDDLTALEKVTPVRGIIGTIRNIADFGAFVDFGGQSDGLLHTSKLGPLKLQSFLIGQQLGVDILDVNNGKVSLGLAGLGLDASVRGPRGVSRPVGASQKRSFSSSSARSGKSTTRPSVAKKRSGGSSKDDRSSAPKRRKTAS